jgi:hypothetical protein
MAITEDPNLHSELPDEPDKLVGRPEVEAKSVGDLRLAAQARHDLLSLPAPVGFSFTVNPP